MFEHFSYFILYARTYAQHLFRVRVLLSLLVLLVVFGGVVISKVEGITLGDGIYFACVTGLTVGYGDIHPGTTMGRIVSILIALVGLLFTGLTVATATRALADTTRRIKESES